MAERRLPVWKIIVIVVAVSFALFAGTRVGNLFGA